jgi:hypothetical protein
LRIPEGKVKPSRAAPTEYYAMGHNINFISDRVQQTKYGAIVIPSRRQGDVCKRLEISLLEKLTVKVL